MPTQHTGIFKIILNFGAGGVSLSALAAQTNLAGAITKNTTIHLKKMTKTEIANAFSNGEFTKTYPYLADKITWTVVEENTFIGKQAVINNCEQVANYFKSVSTVFKTLNVVEDAHRVVINGTAEFLKNNKRVAFVSACDLYEFDSDNQLVKVTSYCIQQK